MTLDARTVDELSTTAKAVRSDIVRMAGLGGCFIGASLSCTDVLVYLYARFLRIDPSALDDPDRDVLLLSKGHDVPALYATLARAGYFDPALLDRHLDGTSSIYWHPSRAIPGIEFHSGSLGHLPAVGIGLALDRQMRESPSRVVVVTGDGELNEGSVWEALLVAGARKLGNLVVVVDRNQFQANAPTESLSPLEPLRTKFESFGCTVLEVDGHDFPALDEVFSRVATNPNGPTVVVAATIRGKGIPSIERRADRWFMAPTAEEVSQLLDELEHGNKAELSSPSLVVR